MAFIMVCCRVFSAYCVRTVSMMSIYNCDQWCLMSYVVHPRSDSKEINRGVLNLLQFIKPE